MCGIIGYTGEYDACERILTGLKRLEYRGYDSAGIAASTEDGIQIVKTAGKVNALAEEIERQGGLSTHCAVGHTRWATHGAPTADNAHPHRVGRVTLVHNGIIENEGELRRRLEEDGVTFRSDTDTEVAAAVIDRCLAEEGDPVRALRKAETYFRGSYAFGVLFDSDPETIYALRRQSPLLIARTDSGNFIASDVPAVLPYTDLRFALEEGELAVLTPTHVTVYRADGSVAEKTAERIDTEGGNPEKGDFPHFMRKEIAEQPEAVRRTVLPRIKGGLPDFSSDGVTDDLLRSLTGIRIVACGTAMHAGMVAKYMIESFARVPVRVEVASEFRYSDPILDPREPVICVSQSGETADTLAALRLAKERGIPVLAVVNVKGSALAREADFVLYTHAGTEIAVASTKAYCVQCSVFALLAFRLALVRKVQSEETVRNMTECLLTDVPECLEKAVNEGDACRSVASVLSPCEHVFFIGRGIDYALSLEGSLKLKEISYIHSEAYAAGELKHGTISLIEDGTPVVVTATDPNLFEKTVGSLREAASRGGKILLFASADLPETEWAFRTVRVPSLTPFFSPFAVLPFLQLTAYETSLLRGCDPDQPRNLAKSVTVE